MRLAIGSLRAAARAILATVDDRDPSHAAPALHRRRSLPLQAALPLLASRQAAAGQG